MEDKYEGHDHDCELRIEHDTTTCTCGVFAGEVKRFVRIMCGKRAGMIAKVVSEDDRWIYLEVPDWGEPMNYFKCNVIPVDSEQVVNVYVPYFGKKMWYGWETIDESERRNSQDEGPTGA